MVKYNLKKSMELRLRLRNDGAFKTSNVKDVGFSSENQDLPMEVCFQPANTWTPPIRRRCCQNQG
jgi:hypothetical protein